MNEEEAKLNHAKAALAPTRTETVRNPKVQKCVNLVDLVKSFQTSIYLQNLASIQPRTGLSKFAKRQPKVRTKVRKNIAVHRRGGRGGPEIEVREGAAAAEGVVSVPAPLGAAPGLATAAEVVVEPGFLLARA